MAEHKTITNGNGIPFSKSNTKEQVIFSVAVKMQKNFHLHLYGRFTKPALTHLKSPKTNLAVLAV